MSVFFDFLGQGFPSFLRKATPQSATADSSPYTGEPRAHAARQELIGSFSALYGEGISVGGGSEAPLSPHRNVFSKHPGVPVGLFSDSAPTHLRCAGVPLGLFGKPKRSSFSRFAASIKPCYGLFSKTLDLQPLRGLRWAGEASLPPAPLSPTTRALRDGRTPS